MYVIFLHDFGYFFITNDKKSEERFFHWLMLDADIRIEKDKASLLVPIGTCWCWFFVALDKSKIF
jgi:hypothetical protein